MLVIQNVEFEFQQVFYSIVSRQIQPFLLAPRDVSPGGTSTVAQKGHTCKLKMLLQTKNFTCKLKMLLQIKNSTCKLKILQT